MPKKKRLVSDLQFKNQVTFTLKGIYVNIDKVKRIFPDMMHLKISNIQELLILLIKDIEVYHGRIERDPK